MTFQRTRRWLFAVTAFLLVSVTQNLAHAGHVYAGVDLRNGKETSLVRDDATLKHTVLVFISSKCPCSMSHLDEIKSLASEYPAFRFIAVNSNVDETGEAAKAYFEKQALPFPVLKDEKAALANEFKAVKTPHAFILNAKGERLFQGGVSNSSTFARADHKYLREALEDIQAGREIRTPLARSLGCAISRGDN